MQKAKISRQQLYAALRNANIYNLGEVERAYLESCGLISIFSYEKAKKGLPIFPVVDKEIQSQKPNSETLLFVCESCGKTAKEEAVKADHTCINCHHKNWKTI